MQEKKQKLVEILQSYDSLLIAFSGGIDSALLLKIASDVLGDKVEAITATSDLYFPHELEEAIHFASELEVIHSIIENKSLRNGDFSNNKPDRCYTCKRQLFLKLREIADSKNIKTIADGTNLDDTKSYRPGLKALEELGVKSPLKAAGFTKYDIRQLAKAEDIQCWDKPSVACLASRFPYHTEITPAKLQQIRKAEEILRQKDFKQFRARHHGDIIRIELNEQDFMKILEIQTKTEIIRELKALGFSYITLDMEGFRSGSMDEVLV
ncbi:MAG: ATP-dependent sacrificial sulfur transferase LarE [Deltaproteobacteria bacterium]|jgi:pyridinium-3,5-biscarboxylic acid mononucleotide sulfurtransferase|nr:ATP-dependent sacrificial sulfur transferase LarE [Deltaproteobacteria bacterium]